MSDQLRDRPKQTQTIWNRLRASFDAPRFCPDDGQPIEVRNIPAFDPVTGAEKERWVWSCPHVRISIGGGGRTAEQRGDHVHVNGDGRPRWHRTEADHE